MPQAANDIQVDVTLVATTCGECGVAFGMPQDFVAARKNDHRCFYCPNGHCRAWKGETEEERLKRSLEWKSNELERERSNRQRTERQLSAARGRVTRIKNRVANGVCPCCGRTFVALARHMATKHPDFTAQEVG